MKAGDYSLAKVEEVLRLLQVPPNFSRKNVMPAGQGFVAGNAVGFVFIRWKRWHEYKTSKHPKWHGPKCLGHQKSERRFSFERACIYIHLFISI